MRTVLKTGGHTSLRAEIYRPVAVYLRLLALLLATYLGTAQCHDYSDKGTTKVLATKQGDNKCYGLTSLRLFSIIYLQLPLVTVT
jgi:hypothetical protein